MNQIAKPKGYSNWPRWKKAVYILSHRHHHWPRRRDNGEYPKSYLRLNREDQLDGFVRCLKDFETFLNFYKDA